MRITLGLVLALSFGCAGTAKQPTTTAASGPKCPIWLCGTNGTQLTGVADGKPAVIEAVTPPAAQR